MPQVREKQAVAPSEAAYDAHGIEPVPEAHRTSSPLDQFWIWAGANVAPINWVLGAIGIQMGLSLSEMFAIVILGNLAGAAIFGVFCTMGHRTGVPQLALSRLAFGRRGAYVPAVMMILMSMGWVATNTWIVLDLAVAALERMGITGGMGLKYALAVLLVALQIGIAAWGFNAIKYFERYSMPLILAIMAIMTMTAFFGVDVHWNNATLTGIAKWSAMSQMLTAIGIGWGLSWLIYASDCTRFTKTSLSGRQVFKATFLGMFVPTAWLACLGAAIASSGVGADPSQLIIATFGVMALPVLLVLLHGPIATNIVVIYSAALSALALDVRQPRWMISLACGLGGAVILYLYLQSGDFANVFNSFMAVMVAWVGVWGGVTFADFYIVRGGRVNISELYTENPAHRYGVNWAGMTAFGLGLVAAWLLLMGSLPIIQGPIALALGGIDLTWLGMGVAAICYVVLERFRWPVASRAVKKIA